MILLKNDSVREQTAWYWACYGLTALSAVVSVGFAIAGLVGASGDSFALYAAGRSVVLGMLGFVILARPLRAGLVLLAPAMALVQVFDAVTGVIIADPVKTVGPAVLAAAGLVAWILWLRSGPGDAFSQWRLRRADARDSGA